MKEDGSIIEQCFWSQIFLFQDSPYLTCHCVYSVLLIQKANFFVNFYSTCQSTQKLNVPIHM